ncbi:MAG: metal ABC transporter ATP-binding protein [Synergistaceae bacterium]|nr:metal ABC transporter ATP-binding protein [Synergistaceae bacterium]
MIILEASGVTVEYEGIAAVKNVSFCIEKGECLAIVGENGSGKSTLVKAILGLTEPSSGCVRLNGNIKKSDIGYFPQQKEVQKDFPATVDEVVISGCLASKGIFPFYSSKDKKVAAHNMELLDIAKMGKRSFRDLSGGEQQRVLLARALSSAKSMLVLDEPTSGLDPLISSEFFALLRKLNKEEGMTLIMVSHDIEAAKKNADKVLHLCKDSFFFGNINEYLESEMGKRFLN